MDKQNLPQLTIDLVLDSLSNEDQINFRNLLNSKESPEQREKFFDILLECDFQQIKEFVKNILFLDSSQKSQHIKLILPYESLDEKINYINEFNDLVPGNKSLDPNLSTLDKSIELSVDGLSNPASMANQALLKEIEAKSPGKESVDCKDNCNHDNLSPLRDGDIFDKMIKELQVMDEISRRLRSKLSTIDEDLGINKYPSTEVKTPKRINETSSSLSWLEIIERVQSLKNKVVNKTEDTYSL